MFACLLDNRASSLEPLGLRSNHTLVTWQQTIMGHPLGMKCPVALPPLLIFSWHQSKALESWISFLFQAPPTPHPHGWICHVQFKIYPVWWENEVSWKDFKHLMPLSVNKNKDYHNDPAPFFVTFLFFYNKHMLQSVHKVKIEAWSFFPLPVRMSRFLIRVCCSSEKDRCGGGWELELALLLSQNNKIGALKWNVIRSCLPQL